MIPLHSNKLARMPAAETETATINQILIIVAIYMQLCLTILETKHFNCQALR